ncbi:Bug family tripartite tricarboxylate transporter substrate binding protein [Pseudomonadota bacterium AL_CKDN230030165-1A_HGKHYDSX7]
MSSLSRRRFLFNALAAGVAAPLFSGRRAHASSATRLVVPLAPGGAMDLLGRYLGDVLAPVWQTSLVVENRPGAGGNIAYGYVAGAPADGGTLLLSGSALVANMTLMPGMGNYDPIESFTPIGLVATSPLVIVVRGESPVRTLADLVTQARGSGVNVGTPGFGNEPHLALLKIGRAQGGQWRSIPYKGAGPATVGALAGETDAAIVALPGVLSHLASGKLRALAVVQARRTAVAPQVPSLVEAGTEIPFSPSWFGLLAPAGTPADVVARLTSGLQEVAARADFQARLTALGFELTDSSQAAFQRQLRSDVDTMPGFLKALEHA